MISFLRKTFSILFLCFVSMISAQEVFVDVDLKKVYVDRYNDLKIMAEGVPCNQLLVKAAIIDGDFSGANCNYKLLLRSGDARLKVYRCLDQDTVFIKDVFIKSMDLPKHQASCAGKVEGKISLDLLKKVPGLRATVGDWRIYGCIKFHVVKYHVLIMRRDQLIYSEICEGNIFSKAFQKAQAKLQENDKVYFLSIDIESHSEEIYRADPIRLVIQ